MEPGVFEMQIGPVIFSVVVRGRNTGSFAFVRAREPCFLSFFSRARAIVFLLRGSSGGPLVAKFMRRVRDAWRICRQARSRIAGDNNASSK